MAHTVNQPAGNASSVATGRKPSLVLYGGLVFVALFKDLLDLIGLGSLPFIGTVVTLCFSFLIFMLLVLFDRSGGRGNKKMAQGMVMMLGTLIEGLGFVLNFLPLETLTVIFLYVISYRAWKQEEKSGAVDQKGAARRMQLQQRQVVRTAARQEREAVQSARVAEQAMEGTSVAQPGRITVRRGQVVSSTPLVIPTRAPLAGPVVAKRHLVVGKQSQATQFGSVGSGRLGASDVSSASGRAAANDATYRIRAAGSRMSHTAPASGTRPQEGLRSRPRVASSGQFQ
jgi:hypothetical protein